MVRSVDFPGSISLAFKSVQEQPQVLRILMIFRSESPVFFSLKESGLKYSDSELIVQSLKSLGADRITPDIKSKLRKRYNPEAAKHILKGTKYV